MFENFHFDALTFLFASWILFSLFSSHYWPDFIPLINIIKEAALYTMSSLNFHASDIKIFTLCVSVVEINQDLVVLRKVTWLFLGIWAAFLSIRQKEELLCFLLVSVEETQRNAVLYPFRLVWPSGCSTQSSLRVCHDALMTLCSSLCVSTFFISHPSLIVCLIFTLCALHSHSLVCSFVERLKTCKQCF